jgi:hypothetical protein
VSKTTWKLAVTPEHGSDVTYSGLTHEDAVELLWKLAHVLPECDLEALRAEVSAGRARTPERLAA